MIRRASFPIVVRLLAVTMLSACRGSADGGEAPADVILTNARVYTLAWGDPAPDGTPAADAPHDSAGWHPDAESVAIRGGRIVFVGSAHDANVHRGRDTKLIDLQGATIVPGFVDSHVHIRELGQRESYVDLNDVQTEEEAVDRAVAAAAKVPKGEWIVGRGWDEGAWANRYPTMALLSEKIPDHPVVMGSLHGFAVWGNRLAFERAKITRDTRAPVGGVIVKDASGAPSGVLLNRATELLTGAVPPPDATQAKEWVRAGLARMARDGYVAVHEAGADSAIMASFSTLHMEQALPVRVYAMLSARDTALARSWIGRGPLVDSSGMFTVRSVKAYYDGALGSRGARLLEDYADSAGHRGVSGGSYGFDQTIVADLMKRGFQVGIHAIGDAGNRETLDFIERIQRDFPDTRANRHRIEHAQVVHRADFARFAANGIIASMEPPHAVEDKGWAADRLGAERVRGAYAWRTMRKAGVRLMFNSDLTGSDHDLFYGLHSAITRSGKDGKPNGGWFPDERVTPEEALRGYTTWNAYGAFVEQETGIIAPGRWADLTVLDLDPLAVGAVSPHDLLKGKVRLTMVAGRIAYDSQSP